MHDLLIVGGGPAGAIAGIVAARAGARVRILERATFPRHKLCGDSVNPGALDVLRRIGVAEEVEARGLPVRGMVVTGEGGVQIVGQYPRGLLGRSIVRQDLDAILLDAAIGAGCDVEYGVTVRRAIVTEHHGSSIVSGVVAGSNGTDCAISARVVIAADGRRSKLAFDLGLTHHPSRPKRWAIGAYFLGVGPGSDPGPTRVRPGSDPGTAVGEMHVRRNCYVGVAQVPGGLTNVCLVTAAPGHGECSLRDPTATLQRALGDDPMLRDRFRSAALAAPPVVLGPLAVDATGRSVDGLLLAGDAAGFIDPMTGDGLRFAFRGGELAAQAALGALEHGWSGVHAALASSRAEAFAPKWRFNRALRTLVASPRFVTAAAVGARIVPAALRAVIARAGDCDLAA
jgi:menaquinone-9 beta-reductase